MNRLQTGRILTILAGLLLLTGCWRNTAWLDRKDLADPLMQRARAKEREGDLGEAIDLLEEALMHDPGLARAHMDLAILLQQVKKDYIGSIYHYRKYLEMRPDTEKKDMIEERIRLAEQMLVTTLRPAWERVRENWQASGGVPEASEAERVKLLEYEEEIVTLRQENQALKRRITSLTDEVREQHTKVQRLLSSRTEAPTAPARDEDYQQAVRTYRVQRGDTLTKIAAEVYGDSRKWERIYNANRGVLGEEDRLLIGQVLVIP